MATENTNVLLPNQLNSKNCAVTPPKKNKDDKTISYLLSNSAPMYSETPWLRAPFGASGFKPKNSDNTEWSINLSAVSDDANNANEYEDKATVNDWFEQWNQLDELMISTGVSYSKIIFGKEYKESQKEVVRALFTPSVKKSDAYPPRIQPKIQKKRDPSDMKKTLDIPNISVYMEGDERETTINNFEELEKIVPKGGYVKAIIQPKIWYIAGKFGLSLSVLQLLIKKRSGGRPTGYAFHVQPKLDASASSVPKQTQVDHQQDSDNEGADEDGEEVEEV